MPPPLAPVYPKAGPWTGVQETVDPLDDESGKFTSLLNGYLPSPAVTFQGGQWVGGSPVYARPGFTIPTNDTFATAAVGGGIYRHVGNDGTIYNFVFFHGKMYRLDANLANPIDVSPVGITIGLATPSTQCFVFCTSLGNSLVVTDGLNQPWVGTNLASTPITGTVIPIDAAATVWTATGRPAVYTDAVCFIVATYAGGQPVLPGIGIVFSEPNQPLVGYCQANYADFVNLIQTGTTPLRHIEGTNIGLYYARDLSWGVLSGPPNNFQGSTTRDVVSQNVGCAGSATVCQYGQYIYFCDAQGRPNRFAVGGGTIEPLWLQARSVYEQQAALTATLPAFRTLWWSVIEPNLNVWLVAIWYNSQSGDSAGNWPSQVLAFDANAGVYLGRWQLEANGSGGSSTPVPRTLLFGGVLQENTASGLQRYSLMVLATTGTQGTRALWKLSHLEDGIWQDNSTTVPVVAQDQRMGWNASVEYDWTQVRVVTNSQTPIALSTMTPYGTDTQPTVTPTASNDGTCRSVWALQGCKGRALQCSVTFTTTTTQGVLYAIEADGTNPQPCQVTSP